MKADMLKKLLQAGALAAEAGSRGSAGNIASTIVSSGLDFSKSGGKKGNSGASNGAKKIDPWSDEATELPAGSKLTDKKIYDRQKNTDMPQ